MHGLRQLTALARSSISFIRVFGLNCLPSVFLNLDPCCSSHRMRCFRHVSCHDWLNFFLLSSHSVHFSCILFNTNPRATVGIFLSPSYTVSHLLLYSLKQNLKPISKHLNSSARLINYFQQRLATAQSSLIDRTLKIYKIDRQF